MFVIDFEQVNASREAFNAITIRHLNAQTLEKSVKYVQGEIIPRKMSKGNSMGGNFQFRGNCSGLPVFGRNYSGVIVRGSNFLGAKFHTG